MFLVATSEGFVKKDKVGHQPGGTDLSIHSSPLEIPGGGERKKKNQGDDPWNHDILHCP